MRQLKKTDQYIAKIIIDDRCYDSMSKVFDLSLLDGMGDTVDFEHPFEFAHKPLGWVIQLDFKK